MFWLQHRQRTHASVLFYYTIKFIGAGNKRHSVVSVLAITLYVLTDAAGFEPTSLP